LLPCSARLSGIDPPDETWLIRFSPAGVSRKEVTVLLPALTAKTSLPFSDTTTAVWESRIGQPGPQPTDCTLPLPPVLTACRFWSLPFAARLKTTTELPAGSLVWV
jgi:hypothetical protein